MRRPRRRAMYFTASTLYDGTILAAYPMRKPAPRIMKRDGMRVDADGVTIEIPRNGRELSDWNNETRTRFQDVISNRLNTRRAIRELLLGPIGDLRQEVAALRQEVARLSSVLAARASEDDATEP